jgi:hypothetical protein
VSIFSPPTYKGLPHADGQLVVVDEELPDGTLLQNGVPVVLRPAKDRLIIHRNTRG